MIALALSNKDSIMEKRRVKSNIYIYIYYIYIYILYIYIYILYIYIYIIYIYIAYINFA